MEELQIDNNEKELNAYKHLVHCYLDILWLMSSDKRTARKTWYTYLANNLEKTSEENHISKYTLEDCKKALRLLKVKYKQLTGRSNIPKSIRKKFYRNKFNKYDIELIINSLKLNK